MSERVSERVTDEQARECANTPNAVNASKADLALDLIEARAEVARLAMALSNVRALLSGTDTDGGDTVSDSPAIRCEKCGATLGHSAIEALSVEDALRRAEAAEAERDRAAAYAAGCKVIRDRAEDRVRQIVVTATVHGWTGDGDPLDYLERHIADLLVVRSRAEAEVKRLREVAAAARVAMDNIGVPGEGYPAPIAYAYETLRGALSPAPSTAPPAPATAVEYCWRDDTNDEVAHGPHATVEEALDAARAYFGQDDRPRRIDVHTVHRVVPTEYASLVSPDEILEMMEQSLGDVAYIDDAVFDLRDDKAAEESLREHLCDWAREHVTATWRLADALVKSAALADIASKAPGDPPSVICRRDHVQNCHVCDDTECCDNPHHGAGQAPAMPTAPCPKCGAVLEDTDGFGVLAHVGPGGCGYCSHPSCDDGVCGICGHNLGAERKP